MALVFYYNDMLEKVTMQKTQQFSETCRFLTIQSLELQEIWQENRSESSWKIYHEISEFCRREFLINNTEND